MAQFTANARCASGCLDGFADALDAFGGRVESLACLSEDGSNGVVTFSIAEAETFNVQSVPEANLRETGVSVLQVKVSNRAGCLSGVTSSLTRAGVTIGSLACACAAGDESGIVSVGLTPRG